MLPKYFFTLCLICLPLYIAVAAHTIADAEIAEKDDPLQSSKDRNAFENCNFKRDKKLSHDIKQFIDYKLSELKDDLTKKLTQRAAVENKTDDEASNKTESITEDKKSVESIDTVNEHLAEVAANLQNSLITNLQTLNNTITEINDLAIATQLLIAANTEQLTEQINATGRALLELQNRTETKKEELLNVTVEEITEQANNVTNESETSTVPLCNITVPETVTVGDFADIWLYDQKPEEDELDRFMVNKTGCTYTPRGFTEREMVLLRAPYNGSLEWRGAIRTLPTMRLVVGWSEEYEDNYYVHVGWPSNKGTYLEVCCPYRIPIEKSTPKILGETRYESFYLRIRGGILSFGKLCENEPIFTIAIPVPLGQEVKVTWEPYSSYGGKILHDCPTNAAGL